MKLVVTIYEPTAEAAINAIRGLTQDHDMVELRVDPFGAIDLGAVRAATAKPLIVTNRGGGPVDFEAAYAAGIDFVDVEFGRDAGPRPDRVVLSHHDYEGMPDVEGLLQAMHARGCAHTKLAVTPRNYDDNVRLLALVEDRRPRLSAHATEEDRRGRLSAHAAEEDRRGRLSYTSVIGMGERGLYSRIAAPFFGSELQFAAVDDAHVAAPGQVTLADALAIYGHDREHLRADKLFAIVGDPAAHSRSPLIHNPIFRARGVAAAYTIASFATFKEIAEPFARRDRFAPAGMSVTAPFKEEAFQFARDAEIATNALEAGAVNTLAWVGGRIVADNTDVDGFEALIPSARKAAVVGAGGTARAARVALTRRGIPFTIYNRTPRQGALPLDQLNDFDGDLVIDTLPAGANVTLPDVRTIRAAYKGVANDLLQAQAVRQSAIFLEACR